ncbi:DUF7331 family protein [Halosegnis marinus]|uniref:Uncharacterized protein n=1 Tax=Halosegnis marinus TaxID=3034023 RepID=A0ABD5ZP89_9EURY|nr:hypothetical protein [Halosegnis sp. DT85]
MRRRGGTRPEPDEEEPVSEIAFEDGAFVIYDPANPDAWLWTDDPAPATSD